MPDFSVDEDCPQPGQVLGGKYMVEHTIATGGMGVVVAARHLALDQRVAIKLIRPELASNQVILQRFLREARSAAQLRTEHVARVLDVGSFEDGMPYIVMEYLDGQDLAAVLEARGCLPTAEAVGYVLQACTAVAEAHAHGVVHRDLKPSNLFLTQGADGKPLVKVLDFGLSKLSSPVSDLAQTRLTRSQMTVGSPGYMAPEQITGSKTDARADVWSLGVILFELASGKQPFEAPSFAEVSIKVLRDPAPVLDLYTPGLPEGFSAVVHRCLERRPEDRYPDVGTLAEALAPYAHEDARGLVDRVARLLVATPRATSPLEVASPARLPEKPVRAPRRPLILRGLVTLAVTLAMVGGMAAWWGRVFQQPATLEPAAFATSASRTAPAARARQTPLVIELPAPPVAPPVAEPRAAATEATAQPRRVSPAPSAGVSRPAQRRRTAAPKAAPSSRGRRDSAATRSPDELLRSRY